MAKNNNQVKADIDFENELWGAANELRGAVAENQYKDYVLSLIFLRHMNEVLFIDASKMGEMASRKLRVYNDDIIEKITDAYHNWRKTKPKKKYENELGFCYAVPLKEK